MVLQGGLTASIHKLYRIVLTVDLLKFRYVHIRVEFCWSFPLHKQPSVNNNRELF